MEVRRHGWDVSVICGPVRWFATLVVVIVGPVASFPPAPSYGYDTPATVVQLAHMAVPAATSSTTLTANPPIATSSRRSSPRVLPGVVRLVSGRFLAAKAGRARNKLRFDPRAGGDHTTFRRGPDGRVTHYQDWHQNPRNPNGFDPGRRFDGEGRAHGPVETPHMHERDGGITPRDDIDPGDLPPGY